METDLLAGISGPATIMVILPHPDDESFATGGVLAKYAAFTDVRTVTLCLSRGGESGALKKVGLPREREPLIREREYAAATTILGVDKPMLWGYLDGELDTVDHDELKSRMVEAIREERADVVITYGPDGITGHPDHEYGSSAVRSAAEEAGAKRLFMVTAPGWMGKTFLKQKLLPVTHAVDIRKQYPVKMLALRAHASQMLISREPMIWVGVIMRAFGKEFYHRVF